MKNSLPEQSAKKNFPKEIDINYLQNIAKLNTEGVETRETSFRSPAKNEGSPPQISQNQGGHHPKIDGHHPDFDKNEGVTTQKIDGTVTALSECGSHHLVYTGQIDEPHKLIAKQWPNVLEILCNSDESGFVTSDVLQKAFNFKHWLESCDGLRTVYFNWAALPPPKALLSTVQNAIKKAPAERAKQAAVEMTYWLWLHTLAWASSWDNRTETEWWLHWINVSDSMRFLNYQSTSIKILGGHDQDDRDAFLMKLRPFFQRKLKELQP